MLLQQCLDINFYVSTEIAYKMEEVAQQESEMEWIHRIDVYHNGEGDGPATPVSGLSFRASEQSKVNAYGGGSSCGGGLGGGDSRAMPQAYAQCKSVREAKINGVAIETSQFRRLDAG